MNKTTILLLPSLYSAMVGIITYYWIVSKPVQFIFGNSMMYITKHPAFLAICDRMHSLTCLFFVAGPIGIIILLTTILAVPILLFSGYYFLLKKLGIQKTELATLILLGGIAPILINIGIASYVLRTYNSYNLYIGAILGFAMMALSVYFFVLNDKQNNNL